jgi:hypothetical protein
MFSWGLRPRLYSVTCFAGLARPGFILSPASQVYAPQALFCHLLRRFMRAQAYSVTCFAGLCSLAGALLNFARAVDGFVYDRVTSVGDG